MSIEELSEVKKVKPKTCKEQYYQLLSKTYGDTYRHKEKGLLKKNFAVRKLENITYISDCYDEKNNHKTWIFEESGKIVGAITAIDHKDKIEIVSYYVQPTKQGEGIGAKLMLKVIDFTLAKSKPLTLCVYNINPTISKYLNDGWKICGKIEKSQSPLFYIKSAKIYRIPMRLTISAMKELRRKIITKNK